MTQGVGLLCGFFLHGIIKLKLLVRAGLLAEKAAADNAIPGHAGGRRSAGRRESDWVRREV